MISPSTRRVFIAASCSLWAGSRFAFPAIAEDQTAEDASPIPDVEAESTTRIVYDGARTQRWRIGLKLETNGVTCNDILATFPIPMDWPEQKVTMISQEIDPSVNRWDVRELSGGARQVVLTIPRAIRGSDPEVMFVIEVTRSRVLTPEKVDDLVIPTKLESNMKIYLGNSPYIDATDGRIRNAAKEFQTTEYPNDWARVEAIYDWVREKVEYVEGDIKSASQALRDGKGDCEELTSLFVAMCRANRIPARMVWIPDHCYPEFYLEDAKGVGDWFPCQAAGTRQFGSMDEYRPVLQKGDRFKLPEKRQVVRYVAEFFRCLPEGKKDPKPIFIREAIDN